MKTDYKKIKGAIDLFALNRLPRHIKDIEKFAAICNPEDVFKTEDGRIKQIQNLQDIKPFNVIAKWIQNGLGYKGEVIDMQYFIKYPDYDLLSPCQDGAYLDNIDGEILTFWIPLHIGKTDKSTMYYIDWNGQRRIIPHSNCTANVRTRIDKSGNSKYTEAHALEEFKPIDLKYGDCVVHNQFVVHYSEQKVRDKPRLALTCTIKLDKK